MLTHSYVYMVHTCGHVNSKAQLTVVKYSKQ